MDNHDIISIWVNNDEMNLCEFCKGDCEIWDECTGFDWNEQIPEWEK